MSMSWWTTRTRVMAGPPGCDRRGGGGGAAAAAAPPRAASQPRQRPLVAECDHRVEERRRRGPPGNCHADGHEEVAGLPPAHLTAGPQRRLALVPLAGHGAHAGDGAA